MARAQAQVPTKDRGYKAGLEPRWEGICLSVGLLSSVWSVAAPAVGPGHMGLCAPGSSQKVQGLGGVAGEGLAPLTKEKGGRRFLLLGPADQHSCGKSDGAQRGRATSTKTHSKLLLHWAASRMRCVVGREQTGLWW